MKLSMKLVLAGLVRALRWRALTMEQEIALRNDRYAVPSFASGSEPKVVLETTKPKEKPHKGKPHHDARRDKPAKGNPERTESGQDSHRGPRR